MVSITEHLVILMILQDLDIDLLMEQQMDQGQLLFQLVDIIVGL